MKPVNHDGAIARVCKMPSRTNPMRNCIGSPKSCPASESRVFKDEDQFEEFGILLEIRIVGIDVLELVFLLCRLADLVREQLLGEGLDVAGTELIDLDVGERRGEAIDQAEEALGVSVPRDD